MQKYSNKDETNIIGWGSHGDDFKIELSPEFEYRFYEFNKKTIGAPAFKALVDAGSAQKGLWKAFEKVKGKEADKW